MPKFLNDFLRSMSNSPGGHALKKWIAVGFFWLIVHITIKFTDSDNLVMVLGIHTGFLAVLLGLNGFFKYMNNKNLPKAPTDTSE